MICLLSTPLRSQVVVGKPWHLECGVSSNTFFKTPSSLNLRYVSPRFRWSEDYLTEEEEKRAESFKNTRLMVEVIYGPPLKALCMGVNVQSRFLRYKKLSVEFYGGLKIFFKSGEDFGKIRFLRAGRQAWYLNLGLICQLDLGPISPFADLGGDGIITFGSEFNFRAIYKKPKARYNLNTKKK